MKRYIVIPTDTPLIDSSTDTPVTKRMEAAQRIAAGDKSVVLPEGVSGDALVLLSFATFVRTMTNHMLTTYKNHMELQELRAKLTAPPGTVVDVDDEDQTFMAFIELVKEPQAVFPGSALWTLMMTYLPYFKVVCNASTEKPVIGD